MIRRTDLEAVKKELEFWLKVSDHVIGAKRSSYLQEEAEWKTRLEGAVTQKGLEESRATGVGEIVPETGVERTRQGGVRRGTGHGHG